MWYFKASKTLHTGILPQRNHQPICVTVQRFFRQKEAHPSLLTGKLRLICCLFWLCAAVLSAAGRPEPEIAKAYFEIAQAYADTTKYDKAAEFYQKAAKDPEHKNAAEFNLARVYGLQGDWEKALPILERQYAEAPGNMLLLKAYAYSLAATGKHSRAIEMYRKLYDDDKENPDSALNYARILVFTKHYDEAQTFIEELKPVFAETNEKKVLDELEEKIKAARENPEKEAAPAESKETKTEAGQTAGTEAAKPSEKGNSSTEAAKPAAVQSSTQAVEIPAAKTPAPNAENKGKLPAITGKEPAAQNTGNAGTTGEKNDGEKNK